MSQRYRVGIIGVGSIGERHLRCFGRTGRAQLLICEVNETLRDEVAERYGVRVAVGGLEELVALRPECAVVCTPAHLHVAISRRLAEAGTHLLIEKPLSTSLDGVEDLRRIAGERQVAAAVAYVYRANPVLAKMREAIAGGRFGRPVQLVAVSGQHFPYYRPAYREIYYTDRTTGGGAVQDALTHVVNAGEWLLGPVTRLAADAAHQVLAGVEVEDTVHVAARHGDVLAAYSLNQHQAPNETTITVVCERGTARFEAHENRWRWMTSPGDDWHDESHPPLERDTLFLKQAEAFLDTVEGKAAPLCSLEEGAQTLRVNLAILRAAETETWQTIDADDKGEAP